MANSPRHLDSAICPFGFRADAAMTDFNTFLTNINTELVTNLSWTTPSANLYKSPPDEGDRWIDVLFTRIAATNLEVRVRDQLGRTIFTKRVQIDAGGTTVNYYIGRFYFFIETLRATAEQAHGCITEPSPDAANEIAHCTAFGGAYRTVADAADNGADTPGEGYMWEDTAAATRIRMQGTGDTGNTAVPQIMVSGSLIYEPVQISNLTGGVVRYVGQLWHATTVDSSIAFQTDKSVVIDDAGGTKTFRVTGLVTAGNARLAIRKGA